METVKFLSWQAVRSAPGPEVTTELSERQSTIRAAVDALSEKHRLPVLLRYVEGMSVTEISQILDVNQGTVHSRLHYAHLKLREVLDGIAPDAIGQTREGG